NMKSTLLLAVVALLGAGVHAFTFRMPEDGADTWVVLVAGSNGYYNYRHQADACHAYQIVHKAGVPDERVIVMMYDDIAGNDENPTKGIIINKPKGPDVYSGVPKDYIGENVTPQVFLSVLKGDESGVQGKGSGKVLKSGPNDHVFVYFTDHGAPGIIAFPNDELSVDDLNKTIQYMYDNKMYSKMVIYIEACESGSMMENLPANINVYATTAANSEESSYACYYDDERQTYLGDVYSVNWMEHSDQADLTKVNLNEQYEVVKKNTNTSHVMEFGDKSISKLMLIEFQGQEQQRSLRALPPAPGGATPPRDAVASPDVVLAVLSRRLQQADGKAQEARLLREIDAQMQARRLIRESVELIVGLSTATEEQASAVLSGSPRPRLTQHACYRAATRHFKTRCFNWNTPLYEHALRYVYTFLGMCEERIPLASMLRAMDKVCNAVA
uniref:Legumain n=1 Tax=Petromyzon marinus TaxID=7757 RepID=S4RHV7_PETMA